MLFLVTRGALSNLIGESGDKCHGGLFLKHNHDRRRRCRPTGLALAVHAADYAPRKREYVHVDVRAITRASTFPPRP